MKVPFYQRSLLQLRAFLFWLALLMTVLFFGIVIVALFWAPFKLRYWLARGWATSALTVLRLCCGLKYELKGMQHLPMQSSAILFAKHQSTLETMVILKEFPPVAWVLKRELLWIPFFGWALALIKPTAIDRRARGRALDQIVLQGGKSLAAGRWVTIFPEGTRMPPGSPPNYRMGGAILAEKTGYPVVPLAHNAGEFWPKHSWIKWPGTVTFVVGPAQDVTGKKAPEILQEAKDWIEARMQEISDPSRWRR